MLVREPNGPGPEPFVSGSFVLLSTAAFGMVGLAIAIFAWIAG
jgi:hypothetical protein